MLKRKQVFARLKIQFEFRLGHVMSDGDQRVVEKIIKFFTVPCSYVFRPPITA